MVKWLKLSRSSLEFHSDKKNLTIKRRLQDIRAMLIALGCAGLLLAAGCDKEESPEEAAKKTPENSSVISSATADSNSDSNTDVNVSNSSDPKAKSNDPGDSNSVVISDEKALELAKLDIAKQEREEQILSKPSRTQAMDLADLQGKWKPIAAEINGKKTDSSAFSDSYVVIKENSLMIMNSNGMVEESTKIALNPAVAPAQIDLTIVNEKGEMQFLEDKDKKKIPWVRLGIYELSKDRFRLCAPEVVGIPRPTQLSAPENSGLTLIEFQRVK